MLCCLFSPSLMAQQQEEQQKVTREHDRLLKEAGADLAENDFAGAEVDLPEVEVTYENTIKNKEALVRLTGKAIGKDDPRAVQSNGRIEGTLTIYTDVPDLPSIEIPISYMVRM